MRRMVLAGILIGCTIENKVDPAELAEYCQEHVGEYPCPPAPAEMAEAVEQPDPADGYLFAEGLWDLPAAEAFTVETWQPSCNLSTDEDGVPHFVVRGIAGEAETPEYRFVGFGVSDETIGPATYEATAVFVSVVLGTTVMNDAAAPDDGRANRVTLEVDGTHVLGTFVFGQICTHATETPDCRGAMSGVFSCPTSFDMSDTALPEPR